MAEEPFGGKRRYGWGRSGDRDYDGRPGRTGESRQYGLTYDHRSEREYTNLPEPDDQIRARLIEANRRAQDATIAAQSAVQFFPNIGKFTLPKERTWAAHAQMVKDDRTDLHFDPARYPFFDNIIAEKFGNPALYDPAHPDFLKYEGLRTNLEVLRNFIFCNYFRDGSFDQGDEACVPKLQGIAETLGEALANDKWYKRPFNRSISVEVAGVEAVGAAEMYRFLEGIQDKPGTFHTLILNIKSVLGLPQRDWQLPPIEDTPFSALGLSAPPPLPEACFTQPQFERACDQPDRPRAFVERLNQRDSAAPSPAP